MTRVCRRLVSSCALIVSCTLAACGGGASHPAAPSPVPSAGQAPGAFGTLSVDASRCLQFAGDPSCFSAARMRPLGTASGAIVPSAPAGLTASASGSTVVLSWTAPAAGDPPTSYIVEAGSASGLSNLANFPTGNTATTLSAANVPAGTYFVRVRASNASGTSAASNEVTVVVGTSGPGPCATAPGPPIDLTVVFNSGGTVTLSWTAAYGSPSTYVVEAGPTPGASNLVNSDLGSPATTLTATGVGAGTYFVRIRAKNACGASAPSNEIMLVVGTPNGSLTGRWIGTTPDGLIISDPQACESAQDVELNLTQNGSAVSGIMTTRTRALTPGRNCGVIGSFASVPVGGTLVGAVLTLMGPQPRTGTITFSLTFRGDRLAGNVVGYPATLAVTRQ